MSDSYHTVKIAVRVWDAAALLETAVARAISEGMKEDEARALLSSAPELCVDGHESDDPDSPLAGDGEFAPFYVFDIDAQDNRPGSYPTRAEAQAACDALLAERVPDLTACLQMLFDPGTSPDGCDIQETTAELDSLGADADAFL